jgi:hypothetical protein
MQIKIIKTFKVFIIFYHYYGFLNPDFPIGCFVIKSHYRYRSKRISPRNDSRFGKKNHQIKSVDKELKIYVYIYVRMNPIKSQSQLFIFRTLSLASGVLHTLLNGL